MKKILTFIFCLMFSCLWAENINYVRWDDLEKSHSIEQKVLVRGFLTKSPQDEWNLCSSTNIRKYPEKADKKKIYLSNLPIGCEGIGSEEIVEMEGTLIQQDNRWQLKNPKLQPFKSLPWTRTIFVTIGLIIVAIAAWYWKK